MTDNNDRNSGAMYPPAVPRAAGVAPVPITPEIQILLDAARSEGKAEAQQEHAAELEKQQREQAWDALTARVTALEDKEDYEDRIRALEMSDASQEAKLSTFAQAGAKLSDSVAEVKKGELSKGSKYKIAGYSVLGGGGGLWGLSELVELISKAFGG